MIFTAPIPFAEALAARAVKKIVPSGMSSAEWAGLGAAIRERSMFSARTLSESYLQRVHDMVQKIINPVQAVREDGSTYTSGMDLPTARLELKETLDALGYQAEPGTEGTLLDLASEQRINLVVETNVEMAQGYGQWKQSQDPDILDSFPALELYRLEDRQQPRDWRTRWMDAAKAVGDWDAARAADHHGRMVARKDSEIWTQLSAFGQPYPPFDFNSGMWTEDVDRETAESLGVIKPGETPTPQTRGFDMEAA